MTSAYHYDASGIATLSLVGRCSLDGVHGQLFYRNQYKAASLACQVQRGC